MFLQFYYLLDEWSTLEIVFTYDYLEEIIESVVRYLLITELQKDQQNNDMVSSLLEYEQL
jgi:hypothetical protein